MAISASQIVAVNPRVITAGGTDLEITGLFLTKNPLAVIPGTVAFTSSDAVGAYFGTDSKEYRVAAKYFQGYDNSFLKPRRIHFARLVEEDAAAMLIGGTCGALKELQAVDDGAFSIDIDGEAKEVSGLDLSGYKTQSEMAEAIAEAIGGVTCEYNSNLGFIITSESTGADSSVSVATAAEEKDAAEVLGLTSAKGATISKGADAMDATENMNSIKSAESNWATFTTLDEADEDTIKAFAEWTSTTNCDFMYVPYTSNAAVVGQKSELMDELSIYNGVMLVYGETDHAVLGMSIAACIDWNRTNGLCTWAFKSQDGLAAYVTDDTTASNAKENKVNFYGRYATRNDDFIFFYDGKMTGGDFGYADAYIGQLWLRNTLQVSCVDGLNKVARVPYTDEGYTQIKAWCMDPINRALVNGVIDPGVTLSESQKAQLINEIGEDVSDKIYTDGYYLLVADPGASVRVNRESPTIGIWYTYGGSVHKLEIPVTAVL